MSNINPFKKTGHICTLSDDSVKNHIDEVINNNEKLYKLKWCLKWRIISENNFRARASYYSQYSMNKEKIRQLLYYPNMVHPFSALRKWWDIIMTFIILTSLIWCPYDNAFIDILPRKFEPLDVFRIVLHIFYILDILGNFITGFQNRTETEACLEPNKIAWNYLKTSFLIDIITSIPIKLIYKIITNENNPIFDIFDNFMIFRTIQFLYSLKNVFEMMQLQITNCKIIKVCIASLICVHWTACLHFSEIYISRGTYDFTKHRHTWMDSHRLKSKSNYYRYIVGVQKASAVLFLQGFGQKYPTVLADQIFLALTWLSSAIFAMFLISSGLSICLGKQSSISKYYVMINQVKAYMDKKDLPIYLRNKLLKYYNILYNKYYFKEKEILDCVSGRLRQDVLMHTCHQVVEDMPFLKQLPAHLLLRIVSSMKSEIFLTNDIIIKVDVIGECMYFIKSGTVAVYSGRGRELCHLYDGAHFGEIALIGGPCRRTASVIAVETCELLRLDREDFSNAMAHDPNMLEVIARIAADRVVLTSEMDVQEEF